MNQGVWGRGDVAQPDFLTPGSAALSPTPESDARTPWLMVFFCLLVTVVPSDVGAPNLGFPASLGTPARMLAGLFGFQALLGLLDPRQRSALRVNPGVIALCIYLCGWVIVWAKGLLVIGSPAQEFAKSTAVSANFVGVGLALYAIARLANPRPRSIVLAALVAGTAYSGFVGILQHTAEISIEYALTPPGFELAYPSNLTVGEAIRLGAVRAFGTFLNPLPFGATCAMVVPLAIHFARYSTRRLGRMLGWVAALTLLVAIPTSIARSSLIVLAVAIAFYAIAQKLSNILAMLMVVAGVVIVIALTSFNTLQVLWDTITGSADDPSVLARVDQNARMIEAFEEKPILGQGMGSITIADFGVVDNSTTFLLAEGGIVGVISSLALVIGGIFGINASLRRCTTAKDRDLTYAMGALFLGLLAATPTFAILGYDPSFSIFHMIFGMLWAGCSYASRPVNVVSASSRTTARDRARGVKQPPALD